MPSELSSFNLTFANSGIVLKSTADEIPITAYAKMVNFTTTLENAVRVRYGYTQLENGITGIPHSFGFVRTSGVNYRYAIGGQSLYIAHPAGGGYELVTSSSGIMAASQRALQALFTFLDATDVAPHIFYADGTKFIHHSVGDTSDPTASIGNARNVGMPVPSDWNLGLLPELATVSTTTIDLLQATSGWNDLTASSVGVVTGGGYAGSGDALDITVSAKNTVGGIYKTVSVDLGAYDDEEIEIWIKWPSADDALCAAEVILSLGVATSGDPFSSRYEKVLIPSPMTPAVTPERPVSSTDASQTVLETNDVETGLKTDNPMDLMAP